MSKNTFKGQNNQFRESKLNRHGQQRTEFDIGFMKLEAVYKSDLPLKQKQKTLNSSRFLGLRLDKQCPLAFYSSLKRSDFDLYIRSRQDSSFFPSKPMSKHICSLKTELYMLFIWKLSSLPRAQESTFLLFCYHLLNSLNSLWGLDQKKQFAFLFFFFPFYFFSLIKATRNVQLITQYS